MAKKHPLPRKFTHCFHSPTIRCWLFQKILRKELKVPLSSSQRKHRKYTPLFCTVTDFQKIQPPNFHCHKILKIIEKIWCPQIVGGETTLFIRLPNNFLLSTIRCLLFSCLTNSIFQNSQIVLISLYLLVGNFFRKWAK